MNIQSVKSLPIISESVTIDVTPLSKYGHTNDLAKVTANIRLAQPMQETTRFLLPNCDSIKAPKVYLPDGTTIVNSIDTIAEDDLNQLKNPILASVQTFLDAPNPEGLSKIVELITTYNDYKQSTNIMEIPAGQDYITFSYSKLITKDDSNGINTLETIVPLSSFTLNNQPGSKANIIILMPFELTDVNNIVEARWTAPNGTPQELNKEVHAGRIILSQYWQYDPSVVVKYKY